MATIENTQLNLLFKNLVNKNFTRYTAKISQELDINKYINNNNIFIDPIPDTSSFSITSHENYNYNGTDISRAHIIDFSYIYHYKRIKLTFIPGSITDYDPTLQGTIGGSWKIPDDISFINLEKILLNDIFSYTFDLSIKNGETISNILPIDGTYIPVIAGKSLIFFGNNTTDINKKITETTDVYLSCYIYDGGMGLTNIYDDINDLSYVVYYNVIDINDLSVNLHNYSLSVSFENVDICKNLQVFGNINYYNDASFSDISDNSYAILNLRQIRELLVSSDVSIGLLSSVAINNESGFRYYTINGSNNNFENLIDFSSTTINIWNHAQQFDITFIPSNNQNQIIYYANLNFIISSINNFNNNISFKLEKHYKNSEDIDISDLLIQDNSFGLQTNNLNMIQPYQIYCFDEIANTINQITYKLYYKINNNNLQNSLDSNLYNNLKFGIINSRINNILLKEINLDNSYFKNTEPNYVFENSFNSLLTSYKNIDVSNDEYKISIIPNISSSFIFLYFKINFITSLLPNNFIKFIIYKSPDDVSYSEIYSTKIGTGNATYLKDCFTLNYIDSNNSIDKLNYKIGYKIIDNSENNFPININISNGIVNDSSSNIILAYEFYKNNNNTFSDTNFKINDGSFNSLYLINNFNNEYKISELDFSITIEENIKYVLLNYNLNYYVNVINNSSINFNLKKITSDNSFNIIQDISLNNNEIVTAGFYNNYNINYLDTSINEFETISYELYFSINNYESSVIDISQGIFGNYLSTIYQAYGDITTYGNVGSGSSVDLSAGKNIVIEESTNNKTIISLNDKVDISDNITSKNFILNFNQREREIDNPNQIIKRKPNANTTFNYDYNMLDLFGPPRIIDISESNVTSTSITIDLSQIIQYHIGFMPDLIPKINNLHIDISALSYEDTLDISFDSSSNNSSDDLKIFNDWINLKSIVLTQESPELETLKKIQIAIDEIQGHIITCYNINFINDNSYNIGLYFTNYSDYYNERLIALKLDKALAPSNNIIITITNPNDINEPTIDSSSYYVANSQDDLCFNLTFTDPSTNGTPLQKYYIEYVIAETLNNNTQQLSRLVDLSTTQVQDFQSGSGIQTFNATPSDLRLGCKYKVRIKAENIQNISGQFSVYFNSVYYTAVPELPSNENAALQSSNLSNYQYFNIGNNFFHIDSSDNSGFNHGYNLIKIPSISSTSILYFNNIEKLRMHNILSSTPSLSQSWDFSLVNTYNGIPNYSNYTFDSITKQDIHNSSNQQFVVELSDNYLSDDDLSQNKNKFWYSATIEQIGLNLSLLNVTNAGTSGELILNISGAQNETYTKNGTEYTDTSINYSSSFKYVFDDLDSDPSFQSDFSLSLITNNIANKYTYICGIPSLKSDVSFLQLNGTINNMYSQNGKFIRADKNLLNISNISNSNNNNNIFGIGSTIINYNSYDEINASFPNENLSLTNYEINNITVKSDFNNTFANTTFTFTAYNINVSELNAPTNNQYINIYRDKASIYNLLINKRYESRTELTLSTEPQSTTKFNNNAHLSNTELILYKGFYDGDSYLYNSSNFNNINPGITRYNVSSVSGTFRYATFKIDEFNIKKSETKFTVVVNRDSTIALSNANISIWIYFSDLGWFNLQEYYNTGFVGTGLVDFINNDNIYCLTTTDIRNSTRTIYVRIGIKQDLTFKFSNITITFST